MTNEYDSLQTPAPASVRAERGSSERRDRYVDDPRRKSVLWAVILSLMPGLGQVYVGYYREAFKNVATVCGIILLLATESLEGAEPPFGLFLAFFWLYNMVDAGRRANLYNQALDGLRPMDLPEDMKQPPRFGSFAGGTLLVALGLVLFSHTMFGLSLRWVGQWWPMGLVGVGVWLLYEDQKAKRAKQGSAIEPGQ